jgi:hypothetical protein
MKKGVTETLVIYDRQGGVLKTKDISKFPWHKQYEMAKHCLQTLLKADHWDIVIKPKDEEE